MCVVQRFHMIPCVFITLQGSCAVTMATSHLFFVSPFSLSLSVSLRQQQQQPHGPQDILDPSLHHTSSPRPTLPKVLPTLLFYFGFFFLFCFLYCYILKIYQQRLGFISCDTSVKGTGHAWQRRTHPLFASCIACLTLALHSVYASVKTLTKGVQMHFMQPRCKARCVEVRLKRCWIMLLYDYNYNYSVYHSY